MSLIIYANHGLLSSHVFLCRKSHENHEMNCYQFLKNHEAMFGLIKNFEESHKVGIIVNLNEVKCEGFVHCSCLCCAHNG